MKGPTVTITIQADLSQVPELLTRLVAVQKFAELEVQEQPAEKPAQPVKAMTRKKRDKSSYKSKKPRTCIVCQGEFLPNSNAQKTCDNCRGKKVDKNEELDKTLAEIEAKRKEPYQFSNTQTG